MSLAPRKHLIDKSRIIKSIIDAESTRREKTKLREGSLQKFMGGKKFNITESCKRRCHVFCASYEKATLRFPKMASKTSYSF